MLHVISYTYYTFQGANDNTTSVCPNDFFADPMNGGECKPQCSSWMTYSQTLEIATYVIIGSTTVIGILTTAVIIILSFVHFKSMYVQLNDNCILKNYYGPCTINTLYLLMPLSPLFLPFYIALQNAKGQGMKIELMFMLSSDCVNHSA